MLYYTSLIYFVPRKPEPFTGPQQWISSFNSVILSVGIFGDNLFIFLFSTLTFFQSSFLREGNVVFFSLMIFFISSTFIFSYYINVCFVVLGESSSSVSILLRFSSVWDSCFSVCSVLVRVVGSNLLFGIFLVSQGLKTHLSLISFKFVQQIFSLY